MKNLFFILFCASSASLFAQTNFIHIDTYDWMNNESRVLMTQIDKILDNDIKHLSKKEFIKSIRTTTNLLYNVGMNLNVTGEDRRTRADRYANFQEYVDVSRTDSSLQEVYLEEVDANELNEYTTDLRSTLDAIKANNYEIVAGNDNYKETMDLLKSYKKLYSKAEEILIVNVVN